MTGWPDIVFETYADVVPDLRARARGATPEQIANLQELLDVEKIPDDYRWFLVAFGQDDGGVLSGLDGSYDIASVCSFYEDCKRFPSDRPSPGYIQTLFGHRGLELLIKADTGAVQKYVEDDGYFADSWSKLFQQCAFDFFRVESGLYVTFEAEGSVPGIDTNRAIAGFTEKWGLGDIGLDDRNRTYRKLDDRLFFSIDNDLGCGGAFTIGGSDMKLAREMGDELSKIVGARFSRETSKLRDGDPGIRA